jgi:hypothetical protein
MVPTGQDHPAAQSATPRATSGAALKGHGTVFLFFSSRLGCLGSLAVSALLTLLLLWMFHVI